MPNFVIPCPFSPSPKTMTVLNWSIFCIIGVYRSSTSPSSSDSFSSSSQAANSSFLSVLPVCDAALPEAGASFYRRKDDNLIALRSRAFRHILSTPRPLSLCRSRRILHTIQLLPTPAASAWSNPLSIVRPAVKNPSRTYSLHTSDHAPWNCQLKHLLLLHLEFHLGQQGRPSKMHDPQNPWVAHGDWWMRSSSVASWCPLKVLSGLDSIGGTGSSTNDVPDLFLISASKYAYTSKSLSMLRISFKPSARFLKAVPLTQLWRRKFATDRLTDIPLKTWQSKWALI